ncbi:hypothetical protein V2J09_019270 [Rumex salicifolius]
MKPTLHLYGVVLLFFLLIVSSQSVRLLSTKQEQEMKPMEIKNGVSHAQTVQQDNSMNELMGLEVCENGDEECNERGMASEAHLDYIYTQMHKP